MLSDGPGTNNASSGRTPLLLIFFLSGASGLIYEVVWSRSLVLVFGSTTHAVSTVLAAFMGGLALGSILVGRRGDRIISPLRAYAILEIAIAALALAVLAALPAMAPVYRLAWNLAAASPAALDGLRFLLACLILLPPTTLMGATLPILSAHLERLSASRGSGTGALYAANTIGAVAGAALSGFLLLPGLGMRGSALAAAAANLAAAAAAWRLARSMPAEAAGGPRGPAAGAEAPAAGASLVVLAGAFAASGAGALIFEVVWTRILSLVLGSSTQAFSIMLTTFLAGLALGSAAATRWLGRISSPLAAFTVVEVGAGFTAFLGVHLFPELPYAFLKLFGAVGDAPFLFQAGRFAIAALVMLPPTLLLGAAFPLAARAALEGCATVAAPVATLYTANTAGAIAGACGAGFLLIPAIGLQQSLVAGCALNIAAGAFLLACSPSARPALRRALAAGLLFCLPGLAAGAPTWNAAVMSSGVFQYAPRYLQQFRSRREFLDYHRAHAQLFYKDGPTTTVSVEKRAERIEGKVNIVLSVNGKVDASSVGDMETQVLLGQLPLLVAESPRSVMVIGMGSGVSAGSALTHPLERLAIVEIEPAIIEAQEQFEEVNGRPLADPRATVRINDARNDLLVSDEIYDVIISEPSNPWITGPSKLFTREFFLLASSRLNPSGLLCQWVQLYGLDAASLKAILRTYASVFPHHMVFKGSPGDLLILGGRQPIRLDPEEIADRMSRPGTASDLARVKVLGPADLLARFRLDEEGIDAYAGRHGAGGPLNTDDNALVEFAAARSLHREDHQANDAQLAAIPSSVLRHLSFRDGGAGDAEPALAAALAFRLIRAGLLARAGLLLDELLARGGLASSRKAELLALRGDLMQNKEDLEAAEEAWRAALAADPIQPRARLGIASRLSAAGRPAEAAALLEPVGGDPACRLALGKARFLAGDHQGALKALAGPDPPAAEAGATSDDELEIATLRHLHRGRALAALGRHQAAVAELRLYFELHPSVPRPAQSSIEAAIDLARAYTALGRREETLAQYRIITGLADSLASWSRRQAQQALERRDLTGATLSLQAALRWNHQDNQSRRLLARALNELGRHAEALEVWGELDRTAGGDAEALRNLAGLSLEMSRPLDAAAALRRLREIEGDPVLIRGLEDEIARLEAAGSAAASGGRGGAPGGGLQW